MQRAAAILSRENMFRKIRAIYGIATLAALMCAPALLHAQSVASGNPDMDPSKVDLFGGYSYWRPYQADIDNRYFKPITVGAVGSATVYLNHWLGVQAEGGIHPNGPNDCALTAEGGVVARKTLGRLIPFAHVLGGGVQIGGPLLNPCTWGWGGTAGVGFDYVLHGWSNRIAIRPIQADYQYNYVDFGPLQVPGGFAGGIAKMDTIRLSSGVVLRFGQSSDRQAAQMDCSASPSKVLPGDPINLSATTLNIDIRRPADYTWNTSGGKLEGKGDAVIINTTGLAAGDYKVTGQVQQGHSKMGHASCETSFTVKAWEPPTLTCSASPANIRPNETSTITAAGVSPQNRPLSYTFTATQGQISSSANVATLSAQGVTGGNISVTCQVADDLGKTATATAVVNVTGTATATATENMTAAPQAMAAPTQQALCTIGFDNDRRRPARVDNEAKGCLDDVALAMQRESAAQLVILGEHGLDEGRPTASERAANVREYLVKEKGIDAARIQLRISRSTHAHKVENVLLPVGASFIGESTEVVDAASVVHHGQSYGTMQQPSASLTSRRRTTRSTHRTTTRTGSRSTKRKSSSTPASPAPLYTPPNL